MFDLLIDLSAALEMTMECGVLNLGSGLIYLIENYCGVYDYYSNII